MAAVHAKRLQEARKKAKLSQIEVFKETGINNKTLSGYENGVSEPDYETLKTLCRLYKVSPDWVLGLTSNPSNELSEDERSLSKKIVMEDESFLDAEITLDGQELTLEDKEQLRELARILLQRGR